MYNFFRGMTIVAIVFALTGCSAGEFSMGGLAPPVKRDYVITGSSFDESFEKAHLSLKETDLRIFNSDKDAGQIDAGINRSANLIQGDSRTFTTDSAEFKYVLKEKESGGLVFTLESKSSAGGQKYIDQFIDNYRKYIKFAEIGSEEPGPGQKMQSQVERFDNTVNDEQIISDLRTIDPVIRTKRPLLSRQEIIEVQIVLQKLGYYTGSADGTMNSETMDAIEKFKTENKAIRKLY